MTHNDNRRPNCRTADSFQILYNTKDCIIGHKWGPSSQMMDDSSVCTCIHTREAMHVSFKSISFDCLLCCSRVWNLRIEQL